jgi:hypothetical protein
MKVDLRKTRQQTFDVALRPFSRWCWDGLCKQIAPGSRCDVECLCECHDDGITIKEKE